MTRLWVPPEADRELVARREAYTAQMMQLFHFTGGILDQWNKELQRLDRYLRLGQAFEQIPAGFPIRPGFFHLIRLNPGAPPSVTTITGPNGEFGVPSSALLDMIKSTDLQDPRVTRDRKAQELLHRVMEARDKERFKEERREELGERLDAVRETRVSMVPGWSQNVAGRRGRHYKGTGKGKRRKRR